MIKLGTSTLESLIPIFDKVGNGITITDEHSKIIYVNQAFSKITEYKKEEALGQNPGMLRSGRHGQAFYEDMWFSILKLGYWEGEIWNRRKSGMIYPELLTISQVGFDNGLKKAYLAVFNDIAYLNKDYEKIYHLAFYDPLTNLPNRKLFSDRLHKALEKDKRYQNKKIAILFMDLNKFKSVNDTFGHCVGDELLQYTAESLAAVIRGEDTLSRFGGDEFVALIHYQQKSDIEAVCQRISNSISEPAHIDGHDLEASISIGISLYPEHSSCPNELIELADKAMYQAKQNKVLFVYGGA